MIVNETDYEDYLEHFGVKGMKWGRHKAQPAGVQTARTPEQKASRNKKLKIAGTAAVVVGAAAAAYVLKQHGSTNAAKVVEAAAKVAKPTATQRPPSPFEMQIMAGVAAQRNVMNKVTNQQLTEKAWRDAANIAQQQRQMDDTTARLLGNTDEMMRQFNRNRG